MDLLQSGTSLGSGTVSGSTTVAVSTSIDVVAGDTIDLTVGNNGSNNFDATCLFGTLSCQ